MSDDSYCDAPHSIHYTAFASQWLSIPGSVSIIVYSLINWDKLKHKPARRFPLYVSISDMAFTLSHFIDHLIILTTDHYPPWAACQFFAFFLQWFSMATICNVLNISVYCLYTSIKLQVPHTGRYDWKVLSFGFGFPLIYALIPFITNSYGYDAAWCWVKSGDVDARIAYITVPFLFFLVVNIVVLSGILYRLWAADNTRFKTGMVRRSILFVFVYIFQFTPLIVLSIQLEKSVAVPYNTVLFVVFTINFGGLLNCMVYGLNAKHAIDEDKRNQKRQIERETGSGNVRDSVGSKPHALTLDIAQTETNSTVHVTPASPSANSQSDGF